MDGWWCVLVWVCVCVLRWVWGQLCAWAKFPSTFLTAAASDGRTRTRRGKQSRISLSYNQML